MDNEVKSYKCEISRMDLIYNNETKLSLDNMRISSLTIDTSYYKRIIPLIIVNVRLTPKQYKVFYDYKSTGKVLLHLRQSEVDKNNVLPEDKIKRQFVYFLSEENKDYLVEFDGTEDESDKNLNDSHSVIALAIGLLDNTLLQYNKETFNGMYSDMYTSDFLRIVLGDRDSSAKSITKDYHYEQILIPGISSRKDMIEYLYSRHPFYNTKYIYFTDFDKNYLYDQSGDGSMCRGTIKDVYINLVPVKDSSHIEDGMIIDKQNKCYIINVAENMIETDESKWQEYSTNKVILYDENGKVEKDIGDVKKYGEKSSFIRGTSDNIDQIYDTLRTDAYPIHITKAYLNSSIFNPDKRYTICNTRTNQTVNAILFGKTEVIIAEDDSFITSLRLSFRITKKIW